VFANPKLLLFPVLISAATIVIFLFFLGRLHSANGHSYGELAHWSAVARTIFTAESLDSLNNQHGEGELQLRTAAIVFVIAL